MVEETKKTSKKVGLPPGTLIHVGKKYSDKVKITVIDYDKDNLVEKSYDSVDACEKFVDKPSNTWINVDGIHHVEVVEKLGNMFGHHPLMLEDVLNTHHRPKMEDFDDYIFFTLKMLGLDKKGDIVSEQISIVLGKNYVISFQEREGDVFDALRERIRLGKANIRQNGADYLMYRLIDTIVDHYFLIMESMGDKVDKLEEEVMSDTANDATMKKILKLKRELISLRRTISPLRDAIGSLQREGSDLIEEKTHTFLNDVHDHTIHLTESIETYRDVLSGLMDMYYTTISNRMNNVMQVLTIIATIFIPLTFVAGIYGMNFEYMPELHYKWAYPTVWALMIGIAIGMVVYFKRKKWF